MMRFTEWRLKILILETQNNRGGYKNYPKLGPKLQIEPNSKILRSNDESDKENCSDACSAFDLSQTENNFDDNSVKSQNEMLTQEQVKAILEEQNNKYQEMMRMQQQQFDMQLQRQQQQFASMSQLQQNVARIPSNSFCENRNLVNESSSMGKLEETKSSRKASQSIIVETKAWSKDHFKQILNRQQDSIKEQMQLRQNSLSRQGIFDYQNSRNNITDHANSVPIIQNVNQQPLVQ